MHKFNRVRMPYSPPSSEESESSGEETDHVYVNKDIAARYSKLRKETLVMKRQAKEEIKRLQKVVDGIDGRKGRGGEKRGGSAHVARKEEESRAKERRRVEREVRRKQHEYEKERKERIFMTVSAAAAAQKEKETESEESPEKANANTEKEVKPSQPSWRKPASATKVQGEERTMTKRSEAKRYSCSI